MQDYNEGIHKGCILEVDVKYPKELNNLNNDLSFLLERMKIDKCEKLVCNLYGKKNYVIHNKGSKAGIRSWANARIRTDGNQVQSKA